ncbi:hypothetical protein CHUV2995_02144 [Corynebacterium diphtheriae subsp. lausannense]|nr:hypothetical protein CHUV2995_02144 [Corynebacterium diphtheriae subsp. lausannense]
MGGVVKRETFDICGDDRFGLDVGLELRDPQGGGGYGDGEVVDLDPVELVQADLEGDVAKTELSLVAGKLREDLVFDFAQVDVGFREEVSRTAGWVPRGRVGLAQRGVLGGAMGEAPQGATHLPRPDYPRRGGAGG